jgi:hypothetical protein
MLKSSLALTISALTLRSTKALWALLVVSVLAIAAVIHLMTHDHIEMAKAARDLALLDLLGGVAYLVGVAIFA